MSKPKFYKRSISKWKTAEAALADILQKENLTENQLKPAHTAANFVFNVVDENEVSSDENTYRAAKEDSTEKEAIEAAMEYLETFEGNLKADHTETHFVFSKVRG